MPKLSPYRNQSIDLQSKSIDWFLYDDNVVVEWVNNVLGNSNFFRLTEAVQTVFQFIKNSYLKDFLKSCIRPTMQLYKEVSE